MQFPHVCVGGKFVPLKATQLRHPVNDAARIVAVIFGANDNPLLGRSA
jgi:hypothetical protein